MPNIIADLRASQQAKKFAITVAQSMGYLSNEQIRVLADALQYSSSGKIYGVLTSMLPPEEERYGMFVQHLLAGYKLNSYSPVTAALTLAGRDVVYNDGRPDEDIVNILLGLKPDGPVFNSKTATAALVGGTTGLAFAQALRSLAPKLLGKSWWGKLLLLGGSVAGAGASFLAEQPGGNPLTVTFPEK